jgi:hypothetical protein
MNFESKARGGVEDGAVARLAYEREVSMKKLKYLLVLLVVVVAGCRGLPLPPPPPGLPHPPLPFAPR